MSRKKKRGRRKDTEWADRSDVLDMSNARFEKYYKTQLNLSDEEWNAFMYALRQPLPSTFRIAGHRQMKHTLNDAIKHIYVPELERAEFNDQSLPVPQAISWYPDGLAWQLDVARKEFRKSAEHKRFHSFLVYETEVGNISRQEAVSMIPPLFLDVQPHHAVIDLCAAPGSKTSQLLEAMDPPLGILIANDADHKRAQLLVHTSARLASPALMVTNLDASVFPSVRYRDQVLRFDRVLADVPCSGDGTLRKNVGIWRSWSPMEGNGLHSLQLRILQRAMRMLKVGSGSAADKDNARIVYSTCSFNPVENEAVVAAALNSVPGFELVDVSTHLPALIRRPGVSSWRPAVSRDVDMSHNSYGKYCESLVQAPEAVGTGDRKKDGETNLTNENQHKAKGKGKEREVKNRMLQTHWPPSNAGELGLERCMRVYPHLQDSGGFFIAVLQRKGNSTTSPSDLKPVGKRSVSIETGTIAAESGERTPKKARTAVDSDSDPGDTLRDNSIHVDRMDTDEEPVLLRQEPVSTERGRSETGGTFKENPFTFISSDEPSLVTCIDKLKLAPEFPRDNIYVRNPAGEVIRSLYLVNDIVKAVMSESDYTKIRLVSAGVKIFGRAELANARNTVHDDSENGVQLRILSEGMQAVLPYINRETLVDGDANALRTLLEAYYPLCKDFEEPFQSIMKARSIGSHLACFKPGGYGNANLTHDLILPLWKSDVSVSLMVDKKAKSALSLRLFGKDITVAGRAAGGKPKRTVETTIEVAGTEGGDGGEHAIENLGEDIDEVDIDEDVGDDKS